MARGNRKGKKRKSPTYQALSLFQINWSLRVGGHWRPKVRGWLHEGRVTEGGEGPGEVRPSVRLRHDRKWGGGGVLGKGEWNEEKGSPPGAFGIYNSSGRFLSVFFLLRIVIMGTMRGTENRNAPARPPARGLGLMPRAGGVCIRDPA
jgi:hypothetical protein